jgi:hypothetical protein
MHRWLSGLQYVVEEEISTTLNCLSAKGQATPDREEILVYLHYMYFYRFALPAIEACFSAEPAHCDLVRFQLLSCLLGRFIDDTVDRDSGFWSIEEASFWMKEFSQRCESARKKVCRDQDAETSWLHSISLASTPAPVLISRIGNTAGLRVSKANPLPVETYPDRVPYYFWLPRWRETHPEGTAWLESYIQALFYWYDIDDIFNDILNNVPTDPAYHFLQATLDSEGRIKCRGGHAEDVIAELKAQGLARLARCAEHGRKLGFLLGSAMIDNEINS